MAWIEEAYVTIFKGLPLRTFAAASSGRRQTGQQSCACVSFIDLKVHRVLLGVTVSKMKGLTEPASAHPFLQQVVLSVLKVFSSASRRKIA
jgi:hypothetical protein